MERGSKMKKIIIGWLKLFFVILCVYTLITITIMRFAHPELSETELFLKIPQAWFCNFN